MTYMSVDEFLEGCLADAKRIIKKWYYPEASVRDFSREFKVYLANTRRGRNAYYKVTGKMPTIDASLFSDEHGHLEEHGEAHFIFLHDILVSNWIHDDIVRTIIHEFLHILHPNASEDEIREIEREICEAEGIKAPNILDEL